MMVLEQYPRFNLLPVWILFQKLAGTAFEDELDLLFQAWFGLDIEKDRFQRVLQCFD